MKILILALVLIFAYTQAKTTCVTTPIYEVKRIPECKQVRVAPFTKKIVYKVPKVITEPVVTYKTETKYKTVCYNKAYQQPYRVPIKKYKYENVEETERYSEAYTVQEPYETTIKATKKQSYKYYYNIKVNEKYKKTIRKSRVVKKSYTYTGKCPTKVPQKYYVWGKKPYDGYCYRDAVRYVDKTIKVDKEVKSYKMVWKGGWTGPVHCSKKLLVKVPYTKTIKVDKVIKVPEKYRQKYKCVLYKQIKIYKTRYVDGTKPCQKTGYKDVTEYYNVVVDAVRKVDKRVYKWLTRNVTYDKKVFKYKTVTKYRWAYRAKLVKKKIPYYTYVTKHRTAYKVAHKQVPYTVSTSVVSSKKITTYELRTKTVSATHYSQQCDFVTKKVKVGEKKTCKSSSSR